MIKRKQFSKELRKQIYDSCNGKCAYCGTEIELSRMQIDHIIPFDFQEFYSAHSYDLNDIDNLLPACRSCNNYKSSLTLDKFRNAIERFNEVLVRDSVTFKNAVRFGQVIQNPHPVTFYFEQIGLKKNQKLNNTIRF